MLNLDTPKKFRAFTRLIVFTAIAFLVLLMGFQSLPLFSAGAGWDIISAATGQEWAVERIAKDAQLMHNGTPEQRIQSVNELQNELPYYEQNQQLLQKSNLPGNIQLLLNSEAIDLTDIDTATKSILRHPDQIADPVQVAIITDHERSFFLVSTQIVADIKQLSAERTIQFLVIEEGLSLMLLFIGISYLVVVEHKINKYLANGNTIATKKEPA